MFPDLGRGSSLRVMVDPETRPAENHWFRRATNRTEGSGRGTGGRAISGVAFTASFCSQTVTYLQRNRNICPEMLNGVDTFGLRSAV